MHPRLSRQPVVGASGNRVRDRRAIFLAALLAGAALTTPALADQPGPVQEPRQKQAGPREYLPALLQKTLAENEREHVRSLTDWFKLAEVLQMAGEVAQSQVEEVERELLEARVRVLQREAAYDDSLDQLNLRFGVDARHLRRWEEASILPLQRHLEQFQQVSADFRAAGDQLSKLGAPEGAPRLRKDLHEMIASTPFLKGTRFREWVGVGWKALEKLSADELRKRLSAVHEDRRRLEDKQADVQDRGQALGAADQQRLDRITAEISLGNFERVLRDYESQPWKDLAKPEQQRRRQQQRWRAVNNSFALVLLGARNERFNRLHAGWPTLPAVRVEGADLLAGDREKAEQALAALLEKPEAAVAGKRRLRQVRVLAETYRIQQRLFELAQVQLDDVGQDLENPPEQGPASTGAIFAPIQQGVKLQRALTRAKDQLDRAWTGYQLARLDLYRDLKRTPP